MKTARHTVPHLLRFVAAALLVASAGVHADDYGEITQLLKAGQPAQAQVLVEQRLATTPKDPQLIFLRGVAQTDNHQTKEAIQTFVQLTQDYPELPEPYNNLAVLYAQDNQLDKARIALEMAIHNNPGYATAQENLGDIYAKLASQAYSKAMQLGGDKATTAKTKLTLIRQLFSADAHRVGTAAPTTPAAPAATTTAATAPNATKEAPVARTAAVPETRHKRPKIAAAATTAPAATTPDRAMQQIDAAIHAWAAAWSARDMRAYFAAYSKRFSPANGQSRAAWAKERRERIMGKSSISVALSDVQITVENGKATAHFHQAYSGGGLNVTTRKKLELVQQQGRWSILREAVTS